MTDSPISTAKHGDILVVTSDSPPVNALGAAVRIGLDKAFDEAASDDSIKAVVLICAGQTFFAGADITEFGKPPVEPMLPAVIATSRWSRRSTAPHSAAAWKRPFARIIASPFPRRSWACPR